MQKDKLIKLLRNTSSLNQQDAAELEDVTKKYPYFSTAQMLYLQYLRSTNSALFEDELPQRAVCVNDREKLFFQLQHVHPLELQEDTLQDREPTNELAEEKTEEVKERQDAEVDPSVFKRKIKEGLEHMGENISVTLASQKDRAKSKADEELEITPDLYFVDDEGENFVDRNKKRISSKDKKKVETDSIELDESHEEEQLMHEGTSGDEFLLEIDTEAPVEEKKKKEKDPAKEYFDLQAYEVPELKSENDPISRFIKENPKLEKKIAATPAKQDKKEVPDISKGSVKEPKDLTSESLAKIYMTQGYYDKAIKAYKKLILKNPEKSAYFASQIKICEEQKNQQ